jgi:hypothetical protein
MFVTKFDNPGIECERHKSYAGDVIMPIHYLVDVLSRAEK